VAGSEGGKGGIEWYARRAELRTYIPNCSMVWYTDVHLAVSAIAAETMGNTTSIPLTNSTQSDRCFAISRGYRTESELSAIAWSSS
jgi:hypothetical protein